LKKFTFIDLFAGCGGLSEGFYAKNFDALAHVEIDRYACETLRDRMAYYGYSKAQINSSVLEADITNSDTHQKLEKIIGFKSLDLIIGGPPCQSFSSLGRAKDAKGMKDDPRNFLFEAYEEILDKYLPKFFVFENVTGLLTATIKGKKTIDLILQRLGKNYKLLENPSSMVLDACDYGVPQIRKRVFLLGVRKDLSVDVSEIYKDIIQTHNNPSKPFSQEKLHYVTVKDAIGDLPKLLPGQGQQAVKFISNNSNSFLKKIRDPGQKYLYDHVCRTHNPIDRERYKEMSKNRWTFKELLQNRKDLQHPKQRVFGNSYVVQFWDKPARTIISHLYKDGNQFIHPDPSQERTLTAREAARLQSFPDNFMFAGSRTQQYKQIGNAVPPLMSEKIAESIRNVLEKIS